jgi:hypothetical protein
LHDHLLRFCRAGKGNQAKQGPEADAMAFMGNPLSFFVAYIHKAVQPYRNQASQSSNFIASLPA